MAQFTAKSDHKIMELLNVTELRHLVAHTNKGELTLMIRKGEAKYKLVLDAVPLEEDVNKELIEILFPEKKVEVPTVIKSPHVVLDSTKSNIVTTKSSLDIKMSIKPRGRPTKK